MLGGKSSTAIANVYEAARCDALYTTPKLVIEDYSGEYYWWWYKNDDPLTFTVLLSRQ